MAYLYACAPTLLLWTTLLAEAFKTVETLSAEPVAKMNSL